MSASGSSGRIRSRAGVVLDATETGWPQQHNSPKGAPGGSEEEFSMASNRSGGTETWKKWKAPVMSAETLAHRVIAHELDFYLVLF
ncbi:hypothetical protein K0M31_000020 [Melipona bicolor]|uniref:Uncharacterized protein n=1 Tax=Melipona bicolor TaxID=60889 RepID=A0AA40KWC6_9HYME|nr:hypothetical protein K0M31_000020 [Melipona bicolor]